MQDEVKIATPVRTKRFHGWRLLGVIFVIFVLMAGISGLIDYVVIGPLEGRI